MDNQNLRVNNQSQDNISLDSSVSSTLNRNLSASFLLQYLMQEVRNHTELAGDTEKNKTKSDILCECQPREDGAAVPLITDTTSNEQIQQNEISQGNRESVEINKSNIESVQEKNTTQEVKKENSNVESNMPKISCIITAKSNLNSNNNLHEDSKISINGNEESKLNLLNANKNSQDIKTNVSQKKFALNSKVNILSGIKNNSNRDPIALKHFPISTSSKEFKLNDARVQKQYSNLSKNEHRSSGAIKRTPKSFNSYMLQNQKYATNVDCTESFKKVTSSTLFNKNDSHFRNYLENDLILKVFDQISGMKNKTDELLQLEKHINSNNFHSKSKEIWNMYNVVNALEKTTNNIHQNDIKPMLKLVTPKPSKTVLISAKNKKSLKDFQVTLLQKKCSTICNKIDKICKTLSFIKSVLYNLTGSDQDEAEFNKLRKDSAKIKEVLKNKESEKVVKVITPEAVSPELSINQMDQKESEISDNKVDEPKIKLSNSVNSNNELQVKPSEIDENSSTKTIDSMCNIYITSSRSLNSDDEDPAISDESVAMNLNNNCKETLDQDSLKSLTISDTSTNSFKKLKRCPKDFSLCMDIIHHRLMLQTVEGIITDELISGSDECTNKQSDIIKIKSSTECCYVSQIIPVDHISLKALKSANSEIFNVVNFVVPVKNSGQFKIKSLDDMIATVEKKFSGSSKSLPTFTQA